MDKQREAFEAWYGKNYQVDARKFWTDVCRCYSNPVVALAWIAWQAALASQLKQEDATHDAIELAAMIMSDCGISTINSGRLKAKIASRVTTYAAGYGVGK